ncbi:MAG: hypothetical protein QM802_12790 [Agriterribacter sp.]
MKKLLWFLSVSQFIFITTLTAQDSVKTKQKEVILFPAKSLRFAVAVEGTFNSGDYPGRYGGAAIGKLMLRANKNKDVYNEFVITLRASHSPATTGGFFKGFDGGKYDNISAVILTGGYRFNFGVPRPLIHHFTDEPGGWFIEVNAGVSYIHRDRTIAPAICPVIGYAVTPRLDLITSFVGAWALRKTSASEGPFSFSRNTSIFVNGFGMQYNF